MSIVEQLSDPHASNILSASFQSGFRCSESINPSVSQIRSLEPKFLVIDLTKRKHRTAGSAPHPRSETIHKPSVADSRSSASLESSKGRAVDDESSNIHDVFNLAILKDPQLVLLLVSSGISKRQGKVSIKSLATSGRDTA